MAVFTATQLDCDNPWTETTDKNEWANDLFAIVYRVNKDCTENISICVNGELISPHLEELTNGCADFFSDVIVGDTFPKVKVTVVTPEKNFELVFSQENITTSEVAVIDGYYDPPKELLEDAKNLGAWIGKVLKHTFSVEFKYHPLLEDVLKSTFYGWDKKKISGDDVKRETELEKSSESKSWKEDLPLIETIRKLDNDQLCPEKIRKDLRLTIITLGTQLDARCVAMTEDRDLLTLRVTSELLEYLRKMCNATLRGAELGFIDTEITIVLRPKIELYLENIDIGALCKLIDISKKTVPDQEKGNGNFR